MAESMLEQMARAGWAEPRIAILAGAVLELQRQLADNMATLMSMLEETQPSSPATTPTEGAPSGESTGSETYSLVKAGQRGELLITATDTSAGRSLIQALGEALKYSHGLGVWTLQTQPTSGPPLPSGATPSTQAARQDGPSASTSEAGEG